MRAGPGSEFAFEDDDFETIVGLVREQTGIVLGHHKRDLVYGRLTKRLRAIGLNAFAEYCELLQSADGEAERRMMVNAITTNLTGFFREPHHFEFLGSKVLAPIVRDATAQTRRIRIWSAGCSSGEEPYSIAMTLREAIGRGIGWDAKILATDIDTDVLSIAAAGRYEADRAKSIPASLRQQYVDGSRADTVQMSESLTSLIVFKQLNLFNPWPMSGPFDAIFCRNVVIYFNKDDQRVLFDRFAELLVPGGWLFIGHSETLFRVSDRFRHMGRTIYQRTS